jgi:hypothetical protein
VNCPKKRFGDDLAAMHSASRAASTHLQPTSLAGRERARSISCGGRAGFARATKASAAGDVVQLEAGAFEIKVPETSDVEIVTVWDLRPHMN